MSEKLNVQVKYSSNDVPKLKVATPMSAGYDVAAYLPEEKTITLMPKEHKLIDTGIAVFINNPNYAMQLLPRSGLGAKHGIILRNTIGLIDADYQNTIKACLVNNGAEPFEINHGDKIAQLIFIPVVHPELNQVEEFLEVSERGEGGFGSTGK